MRATGIPARRPRPHLEALLRAAPAHVPGFAPTPGGPGHALLDATAALLERLEAARPLAIRRNEEALLGALGVAELTAQPARAPLTVEPVQGARTTLPAGTRVEGTSAEGTVQFETDAEITVADAPLTTVIAQDPAADTISDHSAAVDAANPFTLFEPAVPVPHELLLGHQALLDLSGSTTIEVDLGVAAGSRDSVGEIVWDWWDGAAWRPFAKRGPVPDANPPQYEDYPLDGTAGFTRSGRILLYTPCSGTKDGRFDGVTSRWIRARLDGSLAGIADGGLPRLTDVHLRTTTGRPPGSTPGVRPLVAMTDGRRQDTTKAFQPLGATPVAGAALYVAAPDAFDRPGADVTIQIDLGVSLLTSADADAEKLKVDATVADQILGDARKALADALGALEAPKVTAAITDDPLQSSKALLTAVRDGIKGADSFVRSAVKLAVVVFRAPPPYWDPIALNLALAQLAAALSVISGEKDTPNDPFKGPRDALLTAGMDFLKYSPARAALAAAVDATANNPSGFDAPLETVISRATDLGKAITSAKAHIGAALAALATLTDAQAIAVLRNATKTPDTKLPAPVVEWEYWNGTVWKKPVGLSSPFDFTGSGHLTFPVPADWAVSEEAGQANRWLRARLVSGGYGHLRLVTWKDQKSSQVNAIPVIDHRPPVVDRFEVFYNWTSESERPEHCLSFNDYTWEAQQDRLGTPGWSFAPFSRKTSGAPSVFLGFDGPLQSGWFGLWLGVDDDAPNRAGGDLSVSTWDGSRWRPATAFDETRGLSELGVVRALLGGSSARTLFDKDLHWVRLSFGTNQPAPRVPIADIAPNAVWVAQSATHREEVLGSSDGTPGQTFFLRHRPVAAGEEIWVLEASGGLARVKAPAILEEHGVGPTDHHPDVDVRRDLAGHPVAVWVRWHGRLTFAFSGSGDRHYVIDRGRGRLVFGDGTSGMVPPPDQDSVVARIYESVDGRLGNVPTGAITRVISNVGASTARNLRPATGGADQEGLASAMRRGRHLARHRRQALSLADYEALALDASPEVASARAVGPVDAAGRPAPGPVRVMVVPRGLGDTPALSDVLRRRITDHLVARIPAAAPSPWVVGPRYLQLGVEASVTAAPPAGAGDVRDRVETEIRRFLHPADGGWTGGGWGFGQPVSVSDIASVLEALPGVDALVGLRWTIDRTPVPDRVEPDADRVIAPGPVSVRASGWEVRP